MNTAKEVVGSWDARKLAKSLMNEGIWAELPVQGLGNCRFKFRSRDGVKHQEILANIYKPIRARYGKTDVPPEVAQQVMLRILAEAVLVDWENVPDESGVPMAFTNANAILFLDMYPDVRDMLSQLSGDYAAFLAQAEADSKGN